MQNLSDSHKAVNIMISSRHYVIEAISFEENRAFLKIGQQNPSNTVALRNRTPLETVNVPMYESQLLIRDNFRKQGICIYKCKNTDIAF